MIHYGRISIKNNFTKEIHGPEYIFLQSTNMISLTGLRQ